MHNLLLKTLSGITAVAVLGAVAMVGTAQHIQAQAQGARAQAGQPQGGQAAAPQKKPKDQGEYDIYNEVIKDISGNNFAKAVTDLDTWKQKYPESDFRDDRTYFYLQAYASTGQPAKEVDLAGQLLTKDLKTVFSDPKQGPQQIVTVYFLTCVNTRQLQNTATPEQLATGEKAGSGLLEYLPTFFAPDKKPAAASDADWAKARSQMETAANDTLTFVALAPGAQAMQQKNYDAAIQADTKALEKYPNNGQISYALGSALIASKKPENLGPALYQIARAAALDPAKGGVADPKARESIAKYLTGVYTRIHGSDEGLEQLKQTAVNSPQPPAGFKVETQGEILERKEAEFAKTNPQLALWLNIKKQLTDTGGEQYFANSLKDTDVSVPSGKALKGKVVEGKPACRSKEILLSVPMPDQTGEAKVEIALKLDAALTGKPIVGTEIQFNGQPTAFTKEPFLLTVETEKAKIEGLKEDKCVAAAARPAAKKGVAKKKK